MKSSIATRIYRSAFTVSILAIISLVTGSCSKNDFYLQTPQPAIAITLERDTISVSERDHSDSIVITLAKPAPATGHLVLKKLQGNAVAGIHYRIGSTSSGDSVAVPVTKGDRRFVIRFTTIDNTDEDGERMATFALFSRVPGVSTRSLQVLLKISDDELSARAAFSSAAFSVDENEDGGTMLSVRLSRPLTTITKLRIGYRSVNAIYLQHFSTLPGLSDSSLILEVPPGAREAALRIVPVNDEVRRPDRHLDFWLESLTNSVSTGEPRASRVTIRDDDEQFATPVRELRDMYSGVPKYFFGPLWIEGIVTTVNDNTESRMLYVQDGTGGIAIRFKTANTFTRGDRVTINVEGGMMQSENGEIIISAVSNTRAVKSGTGSPAYLSISLEELFYAFGDHSGKLVRLSRPVQFTEANGNNRLSGDRQITDGLRVATVRTEPFASFAGILIPAGQKTVQGILIRNGNRFIIKPQLVPLDIQ